MQNLVERAMTAVFASTVIIMTYAFLLMLNY